MNRMYVPVDGLPCESHRRSYPSEILGREVYPTVRLAGPRQCPQRASFGRGTLINRLPLSSRNIGFLQFHNRCRAAERCDY